MRVSVVTHMSVCVCARVCLCVLCARMRACVFGCVCAFCTSMECM